MVGGWWSRWSRCGLCVTRWGFVEVDSSLNGVIPLFLSLSHAPTTQRTTSARVVSILIPHITPTRAREKVGRSAASFRGYGVHRSQSIRYHHHRSRLAYNSQSTIIFYRLGSEWQHKETLHPLSSSSCFYRQSSINHQSQHPSICDPQRSSALQDCRGASCVTE